MLPLPHKCVVLSQVMFLFFFFIKIFKSYVQLHLIGVHFMQEMGLIENGLRKL